MAGKTKKAPAVKIPESEQGSDAQRNLDPRGKRSPDSPILVVIPYLAREAQGRELEYAVAGWRRHFKEEHHIVIVGDHHKVVDTGDDITFIECPRIDDVPGQYMPHLDHVHKFRKVREAYPDVKGFIYACDDMYAVNDFTMIEVLFPKKDREIIGDRNSANGWHRDQWKTKEMCLKERLPIDNWVCHLPVYYEWDKLFEIYDKYDCEHESYVVENLYFNTYYKNRVPVQLSLLHDNLKCGVYRAHPDMSIVREAFVNKIWISNGVTGWIPELDNMLKNYYFGSR